MVFNKKELDTISKLEIIKSYVRETNSVFSNQNIIKARTGMDSTSWVGWTPPHQGWIKLNTDGSFKGNNLTGGGGLLRNIKGDWLGGFSFHQGACMAEEAELWALLVGLWTASIMGIKQLVAEIDS